MDGIGVDRPTAVPRVRWSLELTPSVWTRAATPDEGIRRSVDLARRAEALGFDSVWLSEDPDGWDAFAALTLLARETDRVRLGTGVTNPYLRSPNLIAASVATLDWASGGRAFLGLGRGQAEWYRGAFGMEAGRPLDRLRETVDLLRQWWRPPHVATGGREAVSRGWRRSFGPLSAPPIYLAATGPRTLALAGEIADGVRINELASVAYLEEAIGTVRRAARDAGRDLDALRVFYHPSITVVRTEEERAAALERKKATVALIHALPGMERQLETPGVDVAAVMAEVRRGMRTDAILARGGGFPELREHGDLAAAKRAIPADLMRAVALVGTLGELRGRVAELAAIGVTDLFFDLDRPHEPGEPEALLDG